MNIFADNSNELAAAFDTLEGAGFFARSLAKTEWPGLGRMVAFITEKRQTMPVENQNEVAGDVYGSGGIHRYFVTFAGEVLYSAEHGARQIEVAEAVGFKVHPTVPVRPGGLYRCCVKFAQRRFGSEGQHVTCPYCQYGLVFRSGSWEGDAVATQRMGKSNV